MVLPLSDKWSNVVYSSQFVQPAHDHVTEQQWVSVLFIYKSCLYGITYMFVWYLYTVA